MRRLACISLLLWASLAPAQTPTPSPAERELQQPLALDDRKPAGPGAVRSEPSGWRAAGSTLLVLALAGGGLWALRKYGTKKLPGGGGGRLKVEESLAMGERRFVSLLRADDQLFLLAVTPQSISLLGRLDGVEAAPTGRFDDALERHMAANGPLPIREAEALLQEGQP